MSRYLFEEDRKAVREANIRRIKGESRKQDYDKINRLMTEVLRGSLSEDEMAILNKVYGKYGGGGEVTIYANKKKCRAGQHDSHEYSIEVHVTTPVKNVPVDVVLMKLNNFMKENQDGELVKLIRDTIDANANETRMILRFSRLYEPDEAYEEYLRKRDERYYKRLAFFICGTGEEKPLKFKKHTIWADDIFRIRREISDYLSNKSRTLVDDRQAVEWLKRTAEEVFTEDERAVLQALGVGKEMQREFFFVEEGGKLVATDHDVRREYTTISVTVFDVASIRLIYERSQPSSYMLRKINEAMKTGGQCLKEYIYEKKVVDDEIKYLETHSNIMEGLAIESTATMDKNMVRVITHLYNREEAGTKFKKMVERWLSDF